MQPAQSKILICSLSRKKATTDPLSTGEVIIALPGPRHASSGSNSRPRPQQHYCHARFTTRLFLCCLHDTTDTLGRSLVVLYTAVVGCVGGRAVCLFLNFCYCVVLSALVVNTSQHTSGVGPDRKVRGRQHGSRPADAADQRALQHQPFYRLSGGFWMFLRAYINTVIVF